MYSSAKQGGSTKVFVIVAVVLALIALGALYGVKRIAMTDGTPPMDLPEASDTSGGVNNPGQPAQEDEPTDATDSSANQNSGEAADNQSTDQGSPATNSQPAEDASELPQTGPAETFAAISLGVLTASAVAYVRSLRQL